MGSRPSWLDSRKRNNERSRAQERKRAAETGGRVSAGSGSSWRAPQDVRTANELVQMKTTRKKSFVLKVDEWRKVRADAYRAGRDPEMIVDFYDAETDKVLRLTIRDDLPLANFEMELVWAAGLFVGEGTVGLQRKYIHMAIAMYDRRSIYRFRNAIEPFVGERLSGAHKGKFGVEVYEFKSQTDHDCWRVQLTGNPAASVCRALYPYLRDTDKGDQMAKAFANAGLDIEERM